MKTNFKFLIMFFAAAGLFFSCSSDDDVNDDLEPSEEVSLESFGFYEEDNSDLLMDYVVEDISETNIEIKLPGEINRENLIARFSVSNNAEVTVNGQKQESGKSVNDFAADVEYLIQDDNSNKIYTVTVSSLPDAEWSDMPALGAQEAAGLSLMINPSNNAPGIAYVAHAEEFEDRKLNMVTFKEDDWSSVGGENFSSNRARDVVLTYDNEGAPYISFGDDNVDPIDVSVMGYGSGTWDYIGGKGFSGAKANVSTVSADADNNLYGFYIKDAQPDRRSVFAKKYDGSGWSDLSIPGREGAARTIVSKAKNGSVYLAVLDFGDLQSVSVYKYEDGNWTTLADKMKESEENTIYFYDLAMDVDNDGNVYLAYAENDGPSTDFQIKVKKYSEEDNDWSIVGDLISTSQVRTFDIAADAYNNPVLLYNNDGKNPVAVKYDPETNNWGESIVLSGTEASDLNIEFAADGVGYAAYMVGREIYVHKFDTPEN